MKHFVVSLKPAALELDLEALEVRTRQFLEDGFQRGMLIMGGASEDEPGLVFIARASSQAALAEYLETSPLWESGRAQLDIVEFEPGRVLNLMAGGAAPERPWPAGDPGADDCAFV